MLAKSGINMISWFNSLDGSSQLFTIVISMCFGLMIWNLITYMYGPYHEQELERGSITKDGNLVCYYRIVKRFYQDGTTKIVTERIKLP